jgi:hypothetical protein
MTKSNVDNLCTTVCINKWDIGTIKKPPQDECEGLGFLVVDRLLCGVGKF